MKTIFFNFHGVTVSVETESSELSERLSKDFSYFLIASGQTPECQVLICAYLTCPPWPAIPGKIKPSWDRKNAKWYDHKKIRYVDYHGEALAIYDYIKDLAQIYSGNLNRLHEICYLLILSRSGKMLDLKRMHKIHALGISTMQSNVICMMSMGGGKTTLFMDLLKLDPRTSIISDDTPLIAPTAGGKELLLNFPIRVGIKELPPDSGIDETMIYQIDRKEYGLKKLIPIEAFSNLPARNLRAKKLILLNGIRIASTDCHIYPISKIRMIPHLMKHMVVGIGLPILLEYFWERGPIDFLVKSKIFFLRLLAMFSLLSRSQTYQIELGSDTTKNARKLAKEFETL